MPSVAFGVPGLQPQPWGGYIFPSKTTTSSPCSPNGGLFVPHVELPPGNSLRGRGSMGMPSLPAAWVPHGIPREREVGRMGSCRWLLLIFAMKPLGKLCTRLAPKNHCAEMHGRPTICRHNQLLGAWLVVLLQKDVR